MDLDLIIVLLLFILIISFGLLSYIIYDIRKDMLKQKEQKETVSKEIEGVLTDKVKSWIENNDPDNLSSFDDVDLGGLAGLGSTNILTDLLGNKSYFTQMFASMLGDDSELIKAVEKSLGIPASIAKPLLVNVMSGLAQMINSIITKRITNKMENNTKSLPKVDVMDFGYTKKAMQSRTKF